MGLDALLVVALTFGMLVLLVLEKATLDALGLGLLLALVGIGELMQWVDPSFDPATRLISAQDALRFFGNPAVLMIACLYVVGEGLTRTGALEFIARGVLRFSGGKPRRMVLLVGMVAGSLSAFLNNTGVVVAFIPVLVGLSQKSGIPASRLMMPLAFASALGGMCTLVGTSTNLLVSGVIEDIGLEPLGMFEMAYVGVPVMIAGVLFMAIFAKKLLPKRHSLTTTVEGSPAREYVTELQIGANSPLVGQSYRTAFTAAEAELLFFVRNESMIWPPYEDQAIEEGDVVMLRGKADSLVGLQDELGLKLFSDVRFDPRSMQFFELAVAPHSSMIGRKVKDLHLMRDYGCVPVAVLRDGYHIRERASELVLHPGDLLLVCGDDRSQSLIRARSDFFLLVGAHEWVVLRSRGRRALTVASLLMGVLAACSLTGHTNLLPIAAFAGALAMVGTGSLRARRAYRSIDWPILIFIIGTLALGRALDNTGATGFFAEHMVSLVSPQGPLWVVGALVVLSALLSSLISNAAVAVLLTPIALRVAEDLVATGGAIGHDPGSIVRACILAVAFGSSICFATPVGHQVNLIVYGPGGYRFSDFLRMGLPLSLMACAMVIFGLSWAFGL